MGNTLESIKFSVQKHQVNVMTTLLG